MLKKYIQKARLYLSRCKNKRKHLRSIKLSKNDFLYRAGNLLSEFAPNLPNRDTVLKEMWHLYSRRGLSPKAYLAFEFHKKNRKQRRTFVSEEEAFYFAFKLNNTTSTDILKNKHLTYTTFKQFFKREVLLVSSETSFEEFCSFVSRHKVFFIKPLDGSCGNGCVKISNLASVQYRQTFAQYKLENPKGFLVEEAIKQHPEIAKYNESSVNTFRVITLQQHGKVAILVIMLRIGNAGSYVDNVSRGGKFCHVDPKSGLVTAVFESPLHKIENPECFGAPAIGTKIPHFEELEPLITELCLKIPDVHWIGWDLALTENGWCLVEGNHTCQQLGAQAGREEGMRTLFKAAKKELKERK